MKEVKLIVRIKVDSNYSHVLVIDSFTGNKLFIGTIQGFRFWLDYFEHDYNINFIY